MHMKRNAECYWNLSNNIFNNLIIYTPLVIDRLEAFKFRVGIFIFLVNKEVDE